MVASPANPNGPAGKGEADVDLVESMSAPNVFRQEEHMILIFHGGVTFDTEGHVGTAFAVGGAENGTIWHYHGVTPIPAGLVEPGRHFLHDK